MASALHFADNAARFDHYHDEATFWLNPGAVVLAWVFQTALGLGGLLLHRRSSPLGRPFLFAYAFLGFAGLLHYVAPPSHGLEPLMHGLIVLEAATGLALLTALLWRSTAAGRRQKPPVRGPAFR